MAARTATKSGNWSDVSVWDGGTTLPGAGDSADSNGWTVTIDQNVDLSPGGSLINTNAGAGWFVISATRTVTANLVGSVRRVIEHSGGNLTIAGNLTTTGNGICINRSTGAGTLTVTGNISGTHQALSSGTTGTVNITGDVTGPTTGSYVGMVNNGQGGTINITGSVTGGSATAGYGAYNNSVGTIAVIGNVTGGAGATASGIVNNSTGTVTISGTATGGGDRAYGVDNVSTGSVTVGTACGGTNKDSAGIYGENSGGTTKCGIAQHSATTSFPLKGFCKLDYTQATSYIRVINASGGGNLDMSLDYPAATDVKKDTVYKLGSLTGSMSGGAVSISPARGMIG